MRLVRKLWRHTWRNELGPYGRGECLVKVGRDGRVRILAPPGVPLAPPEPMDTLLRWRLVTWLNGRPSGRPQAIDIDRAMSVAPSRRRWIRRYAREQARRDDAIREAPTAQWLGDSSAAGDPFESPTTHQLVTLPAGQRENIGLRTPLAKTRSASTFSAYVASSREEAPVKRVVLAVNSSRQFPELLRTFRKIEDDIGHKYLMQAVIALAHARARSHSWRYMRFFLPWFARTRTERVIARQIDRVATGHELDRVFSELQVSGEQRPTAFHEALYSVVFRRSRSLRWRSTAPLRTMLASDRFHGVRTILREKIRPSWRARRHKATKLHRTRGLSRIG